MKAEDRQDPCPYVPFRTFQTAIECLEQGLPDKIDKSLWPTLAGSVQGQIVSALRFLGLINKEGETQPELRRLVEEKDNRSQILGEILKKRYDTLVGLPLAKASPQQVTDAIRRYGLDGSTLVKGIRFFLQAAKYAGIPLHPLLTENLRTPRAPRARPRKSSAAAKPRGGIALEDEAVVAAAAASAPQASPSAGHTKTVHLKSGGTVMLTVSVSIVDLLPEDRPFVFDLIDKLQSYEKDTGRPEGSS